MSPSAPMAVLLNPMNLNLGTWLTSLSGAQAGLLGTPLSDADLPHQIVPIPPAAPVRRHAVPLSHFLQNSRWAIWQQLQRGLPPSRTNVRSGEETTARSRLVAAPFKESEAPSQNLSPRAGKNAPIKRPPSSPPKRPELPAGYKSPRLRTPIDDSFRGTLKQRRMHGQNIRPPTRQEEPKLPQQSTQEPITVDQGSKSPVFLQSLKASEGRVPIDSKPLPNPIASSEQELATPLSDRLSDRGQRFDKTLSFAGLQSTRPSVDRSRLWDFKIAQSLFQSRARIPQSRGTAPANVTPIVSHQSTPSTVMMSSDRSLSEVRTPTGSKPFDLLRRESSSAHNAVREQKEEIAGTANVTPLLQELAATPTGIWLRQLLKVPKARGIVNLPASVQDAIRFTSALRKSEAPYAALKSELARIDGELHAVSLPHILPNMGEIDREALSDLMNQAGGNPRGDESAEDCGRWDPELVKQVRNELTAAGYVDSTTGHIRPLQTAADGKAFLQFLSYLAKKPLQRYGLSLIDVINLVNETIGYGPFLKQKDINGTIRSMDPKRWGKESEVLLHPLMGRANLVINILDLIENNRISMEEVLDLLRIGTPGDILERLEVELEAANIYRNDTEWWRDLWKGQDAEALGPWFDDLVGQIRGAIDDLRDVLSFVASVENESARALA